LISACAFSITALICRATFLSSIIDAILESPVGVNKKKIAGIAAGDRKGPETRRAKVERRRRRQYVDATRGERNEVYGPL
jgi:hypothetical protein